jgi:tripartite-type tricarboxylate transporter receptor subunit TctC
LRWIVPNSPGGGYDTYSRLLQPFLATELRATIVVENRSDAGGLVAAAAIRDAAPDGKTIGIINAAGLLAARLDGSTLNPATDFTVLARVLRNRVVLLTGRESGIDSLDELLRVAGQRPIVIGVRDAGSVSIVAVPVIAELLGMDYVLVTGYVGNTARILAVVRGEVDLIVQNLDSTRSFIEDGTVRPLLQVTGAQAGGEPGTHDPILAGIPVLGGETGVAQQRARLAGRSREQAKKRADSFGALVDAGRLVVAPRALPDHLRRCLEAAVGVVLRSPGLKAAADRAKLRIEPAGAADARADIRAAAEAMADFAPVVRAAMQRARQ